MGEISNSVIVVADDFSETGALALGHALRMGRAGDAEVHVVHVVTEKELEAAEGGSRIEKMEAVLGKVPPQLWDRVGLAGGAVEGLHELKVHVHVRVGIPSDSIDRTAADYGADVIVVGTHGRRGVERLVLGSVAEMLVKTAHCPVLVVRPKNYADVRRSERPEPPRPGEELHSDNPRRSHIYASSQLMNWATRDVDTIGPRF